MGRVLQLLSAGGRRRTVPARGWLLISTLTDIRVFLHRTPADPLFLIITSHLLAFCYPPGKAAWEHSCGWSKAAGSTPVGSHEEGVVALKMLDGQTSTLQSKIKGEDCRGGSVNKVHENPQDKAQQGRVLLIPEPGRQGKIGPGSGSLASQSSLFGELQVQ